MAEKALDKHKIISLLKELDQRVNEPYDIVICGGAAAIATYGVNRYTDDIDFFFVSPEFEFLKNFVSNILANNNLDSDTINISSRTYTDYLDPNYRKRLVLSDSEFKNLQVSFLSKADLVSMKICALREVDIEDVDILGVTREDVPVINENLAHLAKCDPVHVQVMIKVFEKRKKTGKILGTELFAVILERFFEGVEKRDILAELDVLMDGMVRPKPESFEDIIKAVNEAKSSQASIHPFT